MIIQYHEYEILVLFDLRLGFFLSPHTTISYTFQTWIYRGKIVMFEIGIAAPHQIQQDLFCGVRFSDGGFHISQLVDR